MAETQKVSADQGTGRRGWIQIKEGSVVISAIWFSDVSATEKGAGGLTELLMRNGKEYVTSATVSEVQEAMAKATILFETSSTRWKDRGMNDA